MKIMIVFFYFVALRIQDTNGFQEDSEFWRGVGSSTLDNILKRKQQDGVAKNVIVFVGDGMGISTVTMARIYMGQLKGTSGEGNFLSFEKFPSIGLSKTYDVSHQVPDSASTATALFSGVKIKKSLIGLSVEASYNNCIPEINEKAKVKGIMTWAQDVGKNTGIVTTARITHATPAATYAHINNRDWECDGFIPEDFKHCVKDIARQLVEDAPGINFKVILGGGKRQFGLNATNDNSCKRKDGKNLVEDWKKYKKNFKYISTNEELKLLNVDQTDYLLGLFAPGHLNYVAEKNPDRPSLTLMTKTAIEILRKNPDGYVLMVEGARIDMAHHKNYAKLALIETLEFDEAVSTAVNMTNPEETLIIVTADHSHSVVINGYPKRGNHILGLAENSGKLFYETITYANGPGYKYHHPTNPEDLGSCSEPCDEVEMQSISRIRDIRKEANREENIYYSHFSGHYQGNGSHGGEDVSVYAIGPRAHLLVGVYEQNYVGTVISYASCIGPEAYRCKTSTSFSAPLFNYFVLKIIVLLKVTFSIIF